MNTLKTTKNENIDLKIHPQAKYCVTKYKPTYWMSSKSYFWIVNFLRHISDEILIKFDVTPTPFKIYRLKSCQVYVNCLKRTQLDRFSQVFIENHHQLSISHIRCHPIALVQIIDKLITVWLNFLRKEAYSKQLAGNEKKSTTVVENHGQIP